MGKVLIAFQVDKKLQEELKNEGKRMGLSFSAYVRYLLINRHK